MINLIREHKWLLLALFGLVVLNHHPALGHGYMIDDYLFLEGRGAAGYRGYLEFLTRTESQHYAPLYFGVNYVLFEFFRDAPSLLAGVNIILFFITVSLFFLLSVIWTRSVTIAGVAAALMAVHPLYTFAVGYKTGNFVFLCAIFQLLALYFLWQASQAARPAIGARIAGLVCGVLALLTLEWAILLPFYAALMLRIWGSLSWRDSLRQAAPYAVLAAIFVLLYWLMAGAQSELWGRFTALPMGLPEVAAVFMFFMASFLSLVVLPRPFPFMMTIPRTDSIVWVWAGLMIGALAVLIIFIRRGKLSKGTVFAVSWFVSGWLLVPAAMLGHPSAGLVFEPHWIFFASYGLVLLLAHALVGLGRLLPVRAAAVLVCAVMAGLLTVSRPAQRVMATEKSYCEFWLQYSPSNPIALSRLGQIYFREGNHEQALRYFSQLAAASDGEQYRELNNIGLIYHSKGLLAEAERSLRHALVVNPSFAPAWNNLGQVLREAGQPSLALAYFAQAVELDPHMPAARLNLAEMLLIANRPAEAVDTLSAMDLNSISPYYKEETAILFVVAASALGDQTLVDRAVINARQMLAGKNLDVRLAQRYLNSGQGKQAAEVLRDSIQKESASAATYLLLGSYLGNAEQWDAAIGVWREGRQRYPDEVQFDKFITEANKLKAAAP